MSTPRSRRSATRPSYSDASKKNCVTPKSASASLAARKSRSLAQVGRPGMAGRVGGHPDGESADGAGQLHELRGVGQLAGAGGRVLGRVAAERHEVLDAGLAQRDEDVGQLEAGVGHADEVGHGIEPGGVQHARHQVERALARFCPAAVGDRDERGLERLQLADRAGEGGELLVVLRREELERVGGPCASSSAIRVMDDASPPAAASRRPGRKSSSSRTMSSSPKYVPRCTSMSTTSVSPSLAMRCALSSGMSIASPGVHL